MIKLRNNGWHEELNQDTHNIIIWSPYSHLDKMQLQPLIHLYPRKYNDVFLQAASLFRLHIRLRLNLIIIRQSCKPGLIQAHH